MGDSPPKVARALGRGTVAAGYPHAALRRRWPARAATAAAAALVVAGVVFSALVVRRQAALDEVSRYNVTWLVGQAVPELARLQAAAAAAALPGDDAASAEEVQLRLDVLANRAGLLETGEAGEFVRARPDLAATYTELRGALAAVQPLVDLLGVEGRGVEQVGGVAARILDLLQPLNAKLSRMAAAAHGASAELAARDQHELSRLHWAFSAVLAGLVACGLFLAVVLARGNGLLRRAHAEVQALVAGLRARDAELCTRNARFDAALANMSQGLCMADATGQLIVCNARFLSLFGLPAAVALPGARTADLLRSASDGVGGEPLAGLAARVSAEQVRLHVAGTGSDFLCEDAGEAGRALSVSHRPMPDGGWIATYEDVTDRRRAEARIGFLAHHDALTGLPNRRLFRERVAEACAHSQPGLRAGEGDGIGRPRGMRDCGFALLLLDLDGFKAVNDTLGHPAGDAMLEAAARRLRGCVRGGDTVARLGGDEFAVLLCPVEGDLPLREAADALARRVVAVLGQPYDLGGDRRASVGASVGVALADPSAAPAGTNTAATVEGMLHAADAALYRAKADGRGTHRFFDPAMEAELRARRALEADLREALARAELELHYQPVVDLASGRAVLCEALMRWRHPSRGIVPPSEFIPLAEELGLVVPMGEWALRQACRDAATLWPAGVGVAVNLSAVQFARGDVAGAVSAALGASGLDPTRLELEITESVLLGDAEAVAATLRRLRALGCRTALDDFGTGYSSLGYLRSYPFGKIKLDRSFVREVADRPEALAIVHTVASLGQALGMATTAEGVETEAELEAVRSAGCTQGQGYLFARPMPAREAAAWLAAHMDARSAASPVATTGAGERREAA